MYGYLSKTKHYAIKFRTAELPEEEFDWSRTIYGSYNGVVELPKHAPEPFVKVTTTFLDKNLLHDAITGSSVTTELHCIIMTPGD